MFKLGFITDEVSQDVSRVVRFAKDFNAPALEMRSIQNVPVEKLTVAQAKQLKDVFSDNGLYVHSVASPVFKCRFDSKQDILRHLDHLKHVSELAHIWGSSVIRVFTFWRESVSGDLEAVVEKFLPAARVAEEEGIPLGVENEDSTFVGSGEELARFLKRVNHEKVRAIWDPQNAFYRTRGQESAVAGYTAVKPFVVHVHVKDAVVDPRTGEPTAAELGKGAIDWPGQLQALQADGYTGVLSLETHWRDVPLDDDLLNQPGGSAFSEQAEQASRMCMANLVQMVARLRALS
ncbi:MAG: sugar phosphate isomerase/epimerase [Calditrichaeota bacterium]|nr:sugar phosphate isomerase/epimerase [Calditrichota bacterium]